MNRFISAAHRAALALVLAASFVQAAPIEITVMTRNLYVGASLAPIFGASDFSQIPGAVSAVVAAADATKPAERMAAIAKEIELRQPHVVGLQESSLWEVLDPASGLGFQPLFGGAFHEQLVNNPLLPNYSVHALALNVSNALPGADGRIYRLTDFDAILVRDDVLVLPGEETKQFAAAVPILLPDSPADDDTDPEQVVLKRSYGYVDIQIDGLKTRVFNTHLESIVGPVNHAQGLELAAAINASPLLAIALGDFNTTTDIGTTGVYGTMTIGANLVDAWDNLKDLNLEPGLTWRDDPLLNDIPDVDFSLRLDYVFHAKSFQTLSAEVFGNVDDGIPPLFPSDHAGVVATLLIPEPGSPLLIVLGLAGAGLARRRGLTPKA